MVAGGGLPETVASAIGARGVAFQPDEAFSSQLKTAGAPEIILRALHSAHAVSSGNTETSSDHLAALSKAGALIVSNKLDEAAALLAADLRQNGRTPAGAFVMGRILTVQENWTAAAQLYAQLARSNPDFPELHTKLSYLMYRMGESEEGLREARVALEATPENAEAFKNQGLNYDLLRKFDASASAYQKALAIKPDYGAVLYDLGILYYSQGKLDDSIKYYRKALTLLPEDNSVRYNLAIAYGDKHEYDAAIEQLREVKRRDPANSEARMLLGTLLAHRDPGAAVVEYSQLEKDAPDYTPCHFCFAQTLMKAGKFEQAEKEYHIAISSDPTSAGPHLGLGYIYESRKDYEQALSEYRIAQRLDGNSSESLKYMARILMIKKDYVSAAGELKTAEDLAPQDPDLHGMRGEALALASDHNGAIAEFKEALSISPKDLRPRLDLALALEQKGEWVESLSQYRQAATDEAPPLTDGAPHELFDAQGKYQAAQERFVQHLAGLRSAGRSAEAGLLESAWRSRSSAPNLDAEYHEALQSSMNSVLQLHFDQAESAAQKAIDIAGKITPGDARLSEAVAQLGLVYVARRDYGKAEQNFQRQLALLQKMYGPDSPFDSAALTNLANLARKQQNYPAAESYFDRIIAIDRKAYGENSEPLVSSLNGMAHIYFDQKDFPKTEAILLRGQKITEAMFGPDDVRTGVNLNFLCYVYDQWGNWQKSATCHARIVSIAEKQFGADSPYVVQDLTAEAKALRLLGREAEASKLDERVRSFATAQANR